MVLFVVLPVFTKWNIGLYITAILYIIEILIRIKKIVNRN